METEPGTGSSAHDPMDSLEDHDEDDELPLSKISVNWHWVFGSWRARY